MKYFVVSDVHSFYTLMQEALKREGFDEENPNHKVILIGDAFDRGKETVLMLDWINEMLGKEKLIYIMGNHEDLLLKAIYRRNITTDDYWNGTADTIIDLAHFINPLVNRNSSDGVKCDTAYISGVTKLISENAVRYFETKHYIFTHGFLPVLHDDLGYPIYNPNWREASEKDFYYSRWLNGMQLCMESKIKDSKTIVVGHYHASYGNLRQKYNWDKDKIKALNSDLEYEDKELFRPFYGDGIIAIDACTAYSGFVNCIVIED